MGNQNYADFVGRKGEITDLKERYESPQSEFMPVYGRRRVGKSSLILEAFNNKPHIYFLGKQAPANMQLTAFMRTAGRALSQPAIEDVQPRDWLQAIELVMAHAPKNQKLVLTLDEFQWTAEASPELPSVLQELWDLKWQKSGKVFLILCGSYLGFMEREVLGNKSPLYGRRTGQIFLQPFKFHETAKFYPNWSVADQARAYFICGGIPYYLNCFSKSASIPENIRTAFVGERASLHYETDFLLREELREIENYHAVLTSLASGSLPNREIARETGLEVRQLTHYLKTLADLRYISKRYPLTEKPPTARQVRYSLDDPLLRFWFHFIFPNLGYLSQVPPDKGFQEIIKPKLDAYFGYCFERLCREALKTIYVKESVTGPFEVGEYWDKSTQIDVVGRRGDDWIDIGECKWGRTPSWTSLEKDLQEKLASYPNGKNLTIQRRIFVKQRPTKLPKTFPSSIKIHDLEELYALD